MFIPGQYQAIVILASYHRYLAMQGAPVPVADRDHLFFQVNPFLVKGLDIIDTYNI